MQSSTTNHLFGTDVAATSSTKSETRSTTEYVLTEDSLEMGVKDLSLGKGKPQITRTWTLAKGPSTRTL
jgi:predicted GTPase